MSAGDRKVRTAVIPAAGLGTRFLPASKAVAKEMMPVLARPTIQYAVEEAVAAGIERVVIVTREGKEGFQQHFSHDHGLEHWLGTRGRVAELEAVRRVAELAEFHFVLQDQPLGLGHAVRMARPLVSEDAFAVLLPDDVFSGPVPCIGELIGVHVEHGGSVLALTEIDDEHVSRFGVIDALSSHGRRHAVRRCLEKPSLSEAPSRLGMLGRYVLEASIFEALAELRPGTGGELQLTDAVSDLAQAGGVVWGYQFESKFHDTGTVPAYIRTVVELALEDAELGPGLRQFLRQIDLN